MADIYARPEELSFLIRGSGGPGDRVMKTSKLNRYHSPHMPRRGAPQAHGPGSDDKPPRALPETAKVERSWATLRLEHLLHVTSSVADGTNFSNLAPQSRHSYSKIGIVNPSENISDVLGVFNWRQAKWQGRWRRDRARKRLFGSDRSPQAEAPQASRFERFEHLAAIPVLRRFCG
jgi:hypothetical protein